MRKPPLALPNGIGRHVALVAVTCGLVVAILGLLLQAGQQQRQYREMQSLLLRQTVEQAAQQARSRIDRADAVLRSEIQAASEGKAAASDVMAQLARLPAFGEVAILPFADNRFELGEHEFHVPDGQLAALGGGKSMLITPDDAAPGASLYLLHPAPSHQGRLWVLIELRGDWLWPGLGAPGAQLAVFDSRRGKLHSSIQQGPPDLPALLSARMAELSADGPGLDIALQEGRTDWAGAIEPFASRSALSTMTLAVVAVEPVRPWLTTFWAALRSGSLTLPVLLLLALVLTRQFANKLQRPLHQLRRAIDLLPDRRVSVASGPEQFAEVRQLVEVYNRTAEAVETQNGMRRVLDELDALLLPGGDYESVIDQVLTRVRAVTRARNVGLALVDPGIAGHGRLYVVSAEGGAPVNRVTLDRDMISTLQDADQGMTIERFEAGRHSFLEPLHAGGSSCFWVWPVRASDELAAILTVGYDTRKQASDSIGDIGFMCAQRLGLSLSNNARSERLYRQAHFDPLTQLPNRQLFRQQLQQELDQAQRDETVGALLYIDLDHFKRVNDSLGHEAGDKLLAFVAQRLQGCVKEGDTVARLGGDEFTVILRGIEGKAEVAAVAERIVEAMRHPMWLGGRDHLVQASIGITMFPEDGVDLDQLIHHADLAMYRAKDLGRSGAVFYSATVESRTSRIADSGLFRAMHQREFSLFYQPQYRMDDGKLVGLEALLRWYRPRHGLISPAEFIPAAEDSGFIVELGNWVIEVACAQIAQWRDSGVIVPRVALNLSLQQLVDPSLLDCVRKQLDRYQLLPDALEFEMNEAALTDLAAAGSIQALSEMGIRLTLDDFGTGSTALANLRRYPVSAVKIDRSFVAQLMDSQSATALANTIIVMAHSQRKQVIAEGVETLEQLEYLREHDCDIGQGFFLARPLSAADTNDLLLGTRDRQGRSARA